MIPHDTAAVQRQESEKEAPTKEEVQEDINRYQQMPLETKVHTVRYDKMIEKYQV